MSITANLAPEVPKSNPRYSLSRSSCCLLLFPFLRDIETVRGLLPDNNMFPGRNNSMKVLLESVEDKKDEEKERLLILKV